MAGAHDAEVAAIERRHFGGVEPLCGGDHRGVDGAKRQVAVFGDELGYANRVPRVQRLDREAQERGYEVDLVAARLTGWFWPG